jgi:type I restriction enzyme S subunit
MRNSWEVRSLGDLCEVVGGGTPSKDKPAYYSGKIPWATVRDMRHDVITETECRITREAVQSSATNVIPSGNVVIATRVGLGKVCLLAQDTAINQDLRGIIPRNAKNLSVRFLFWWLKSISKEIVAEGTGATVQGVKLPFVKSLQIPYLPLPEQERIVGVLDEAFEGIATAKANAEKNLQNARTLFESHLQSVFMHRGAKWDRMTLETLLDRGWIESHLDGNHGGDYPRKEEFIGQGVPYISANCLDNDSVDMARAKYLSASRAALLRKGIAKDNDVLFAHNATVGPVAILHTDEEKVILGTSLTYYRCNPKYILPEYLAHYMRSFGFKTQYLQVMRQSTRNQVPITKQREFFHVIPPLREQNQLIGALDGLFENGRYLAAVYESKLAALEGLKKSLLHRAFTGEL